MGSAKKKKVVILILILASALLLSGAAIAGFFYFRSIRMDKEDAIVQQIQEVITQNRQDVSADTTGGTIADNIFNQAVIHVQSTEEENVVVAIEAPDIVAIYMRILQEYGDVEPESAEEYHKLVDEVLAKTKESLIAEDVIKKTFEVTLVYDEDGNVEMTYELIDALYGGLLTFQSQMVEDYIEEG